jgi:dTDP-4-amino-4,6-dideoxygalactose transaminase
MNARFPFRPQSVQQVSLLDVTRGNDPLLPEILEAIQEISSKGQFVGGPYCQQLEQDVSKYCQSNYAIGCASGSDALLLALMALEIGPGDEVIVPSFTFFATASAVWRLGAKPVFVDIDEQTFNIDPAEIERAVNPRTKAIIPVHLFGQCADMSAINDIAQRHQLRVIEDAAQSIGARFQNRMACGLGDIGCLSFYPTKNLGGFGDGGMIVTNDEELANRLRKYANHGMNRRYYHDVVGINSRLDAIQAAAIQIKLRTLPQLTIARRENASRYQQMFTDSKLAEQMVLPQETPGSYHVWNQYTVRVVHQDRDQFRGQLQHRGVGSEIYYPVPLHLQECFRSLGYQPGSLPKTERASEQVLSLPIYPELEIFEQEFVVQQMSELLATGIAESRRAA